MMRIIAPLAVLFGLATAMPGLSAADDAGVVTRPQEDALVSARAGMGYYFWRMQYYSETETSPVFNHSIQPYLMKRIDLQAHVFPFTLGLDYLTSAIRGGADFESDDRIEENRDPLARQLTLLGGLQWGDYLLKTDVVFRKFSGNITTQGVETDFLPGNIPVNYYRSDGTHEVLYPGEEVGWFTRYRMYAIAVVKKNRGNGMEMGGGIQYVEYDVPVELSLGIGNDRRSDFTIPEIPIALMLSKVKSYNAVFSVRDTRPVAGFLFLEMQLPLALGITTIDNPYMGLRPQMHNPRESGFTNFMQLPVSNITASIDFQVSLQYVRPHFKIELGGNLNMVYSDIFNYTSLDRDLPYLDSDGVTMQSLPAGTDITVNTTLWEFFWGVHFLACAYF